MVKTRFADLIAGTFVEHFRFRHEYNMLNSLPLQKKIEQVLDDFPVSHYLPLLVLIPQHYKQARKKTQYFHSIFSDSNF